tara:strand:+ start:1 stop:795 length:795 start_codon:yes stop_codon:yes gene_type:complete
MKGIKKGLREEDHMNSEMDTKPKSKKEKKEEDDPRSMPTKVNLAKNKLRAMGLNMGYEHDKGLVDAYQKVYDKVDEAKVDKEMIFGKSAARNERRFGKKGHFDPAGAGSRGQGTSERAQLAVKRTQEHQARRGVKTKGMKEEVLDEKGLIKEILEKGARGKIDFNTGKQTTDTGKKTKEGYPISQEKQVMKTKRVTVNNPKGRKRNQSPAGKTIGKLQQVKQKQYDAERKGDRKAADKAFERRKKLSGTLYDKTGKFYDRADND